MTSAAYKFIAHDRTYSSWEIVDAVYFQKIDPTTKHFDPIEEKLFSNDVFTFEKCDSEKITLLHSIVRTEPSIPGVLSLSGNKTYGRENKKNNKKEISKGENQKKEQKEGSKGGNKKRGQQERTQRENRKI